MHKLRIRLLMVLLCAVQSSLRSMEIIDIENEDNKKLFEIIAYNLPRDGHDARRTFSLINVTCNKAIEVACKEYKKEIEEYIQKNKDTLPSLTGAISWNKDFSKCAWVRYHGDVAAPKRLGLTCIGKSDGQIIQQSAMWTKFYFPIFENNIRPFFDEDGRASFYGYGNIRTCRSDDTDCTQYCFDLNGNALRYRCCFYYYTNPDDSFSYCEHDLFLLLQYPVLVKAFLQSTKVIINDCCRNYDQIKKFGITGITIPEDYKLFKKSTGLEQVEEKRYMHKYSLYTSYDSLKPELRKAIDDQYEKQQGEKLMIEDVVEKK